MYVVHFIKAKEKTEEGKVGGAKKLGRKEMFRYRVSEQQGKHFSSVLHS